MFKAYQVHSNWVSAIGTARIAPLVTPLTPTLSTYTCNIIYTVECVLYRFLRVRPSAVVWLTRYYGGMVYGGTPRDGSSSFCRFTSNGSRCNPLHWLGG